MRSALVISAHPDDVDFGAAGTVATWTAAGIEVSYCVVTSGEASGDLDRDAAEMARIRQAEQRAAAEQVGVRDVTFLGYPDGALEPSLTLRRDLTRVIRLVRPELVLTWSPEINWAFVATTHPDHRATGSAAFASVFPDARNPHAHPELLADEGLEPWAVRQLWLVDGPIALRNHAVDVTTCFDKKMAALHAHVSQVGEGLGLDEGIRAYLSGIAARHGLAQGQLAEDFQVVNTS